VSNFSKCPTIIPKVTKNDPTGLCMTEDFGYKMCRETENPNKRGKMVVKNLSRSQRLQRRI